MNQGSDITIVNILDVFFRMETEEGLFSARTSDGIFFWDIVRREVYLTLHTLHGGPFLLPSLSAPPSLASWVKDLVKPFVNLLSRRYLASKAPKYIFITNQRVREGASLVDNISDPLFDLVANDAIAVELMNRSAIDPWSLLVGGKTRLPYVAVRSKRDEVEAARLADDINAVVHKHFGMRANFTRLIGDLLFLHRTTLTYYRRILKKFRPKAIVCVNNGSLSGMFCAAKEHGVPAVELQHGASSHHTIIWSYPPSIEASHPGLALPTAYLTYSDYWNHNTHFPVKMIRAIGNDSLFQEPIASDSVDVLMISSYMYRDALRDLAIELADMDPTQQIYFKLHPHEYNQEVGVVASFGGRRNIRVVRDEFTFQQLFQRCGYVVGVQSTVVYLALQAGCRVCLLKRSNYFWHDDIFDHIDLFDGAAELHRITHGPRRHGVEGTIPVFSARRDPDAFLQALVDLQSASFSQGST